MANQKVKATAQYSKSAAQEDLEARQAEDWQPATKLAQTTETSPYDRGGFIGVDPIYQNAANETERPMRADEGPEAQVEAEAGQSDNKWDGEEAVPDVPTYLEMVQEEIDEKKAEEKRRNEERKAEQERETSGGATDGDNTDESASTTSAPVSPTMPTPPASNPPADTGKE